MSVKIKDINVDKVLRITTRCRVINTQDHIIKDHLEVGLPNSRLLSGLIIGMRSSMKITLKSKAKKFRELRVIKKMTFSRLANFLEMNIFKSLYFCS